MTNDLVKIVHSIPEAARPGVLGKLLDQRRSASGSILAFKTHMGQYPSYVASVPLAWVAEHIRFAADMPEFIGKANPVSKEIKIDDFSIDHIQQRQPDWRRQIRMAVYLAVEENHKFPPMLIAGRVSAVPLGCGLCELSVDKDTLLHALDGQHRLMAILGVRQLAQNKRLLARDQDGNEKAGREVTLGHVAQAIQKRGGEKLDDDAVVEKMEKILTEEIGIEIIPTNKPGELRSIFVDVNENAKKPSTGESILLDERNGFRIVARKVMVSHPLLQKRVCIRKRSLLEADKDYTALETIEDIATLHLGQDEEFSKWKIPIIPHEKPSGFIRPDGLAIGDGINELSVFFNGLMRLPSHIRMVEENLPASFFRKGDKSHVLFRPLAQMAFAKASAILKHEHGISLEDAVDELIRQEERGGQLGLKGPNTPWCGVLWNSVDGRMRAGPRVLDLCVRLFVYLLGGKLDEKKLQDDFAESRQTYGQDLTLPAPWR